MSAVVRYLGGGGAVAWAMSLLWSDSVHAQSASFIRDCQKWIERKGYSTDYIEQKTGKRQPGLAGSWRGNIPVQNVQPGDVVLVRLRAPGAMHAALVEEVRKNADGAVSGIRLSEWNGGQMTDQRCLVTENFGRLSPGRWIDLDAVAQVWRTSLPLQE
jgi:hypothetical protein